jgi:hypothetical protein
MNRSRDLWHPFSAQAKPIQKYLLGYDDVCTLKPTDVSEENISSISTLFLTWYTAFYPRRCKHYKETNWQTRCYEDTILKQTETCPWTQKCKVQTCGSQTVAVEITKVSAATNEHAIIEDLLEVISIKVEVTLRLTASQSKVLVSRYLLLLDSHDLVLWGALSDERTGLSFVYAVGPCQRSLCRIRGPWTIFYCLRSETSFSVASYVSQWFISGHVGALGSV